MYYMCKNSKQLQKKLQVGDRVRIISRAKVKSIEESKHKFMFGFNEYMLEYCDKEFVIIDKRTITNYIYDDGSDSTAFKLKNAGGFAYCVEMFETPSVLLKNE